MPCLVRVRNGDVRRLVTSAINFNVIAAVQPTEGPTAYETAAFTMSCACVAEVLTRSITKHGAARRNACTLCTEDLLGSKCVSFPAGVQCGIVNVNKRQALNCACLARCLAKFIGHI